MKSIRLIVVPGHVLLGGGWKDTHLDAVLFVDRTDVDGVEPMAINGLHAVVVNPSIEVCVFYLAVGTLGIGVGFSGFILSGYLAGLLAE